MTHQLTVRYSTAGGYRVQVGLRFTPGCLPQRSGQEMSSVKSQRGSEGHNNNADHTRVNILNDVKLNQIRPNAGWVQDRQRKCFSFHLFVVSSSSLEPKDVLRLAGHPSSLICAQRIEDRSLRRDKWGQEKEGDLSPLIGGAAIRGSYFRCGSITWRTCHLIQEQEKTQGITARVWGVVTVH